MAAHVARLDHVHGRALHARRAHAARRPAPHSPGPCARAGCTRVRSPSIMAGFAYSVARALGPRLAAALSSPPARPWIAYACTLNCCPLARAERRALRTGSKGEMGEFKEGVVAINHVGLYFKRLAERGPTPPPCHAAGRANVRQRVARAPGASGAAFRVGARGFNTSTSHRTPRHTRSAASSSGRR